MVNSGPEPPPPGPSAKDEPPERGFRAPPWALSANNVLATLEVESQEGLTEAEAQRRLRRSGPNRLRRVELRHWLAVLGAQLRSLIVLLLAVAAALSFAYGQPVEGAAILGVIALNTLLGFATELRAVRSMEALRQLSEITARVRRGGTTRQIPAQELVPGDVVLLEGGEVVSADLRLIEASRVEADESNLTGESIPVPKRTDPVPGDSSLGDRACMAYKGTAITRGAGEGVVVSTGLTTELGRISALIADAENGTTPLEDRIAHLGNRLARGMLLLVAATALIGILAGSDLLMVVKSTVALAVATIPEGLPIVATIALARGMWRMAKRNAVIERLAAVETLGSTSVLLTDKTGTLTENQLAVTQIVCDRSGNGFVLEETGTPAASSWAPRTPGNGAPGVERLHEILRTGALCTDASLAHPEAEDAAHATGDPLEVALLVAAARAGFHRETLVDQFPELREEAFDHETRAMATFHRDSKGVLVAIKGAPEAIIQASTQERDAEGARVLDAVGRTEWLECADSLAREGQKVLAIATRRAASLDEPPYKNLTLLGLAGLTDPPRLAVRDAIQACRRAGLHVVMVTGDHPATARKIAHAVGLSTNASSEIVSGRDLFGNGPVDRDQVLGAKVIARLSPEQKLRVLRLYQETGAVVAMIGDGVNDAPALKQADIGIAMGRRGTQVAREAAAMVLRDDELDTVVVAVEQGRVIFENIRKFLVYLFSCNLSEVLVVAGAALAQAPLALLPLQILFLNLVTDVFPALALGVGEGSPQILNRPPRPRSEPILTRRHWVALGGYSLLIAAAVLTAFGIAIAGLHMSGSEAVTVSFLTLATAQTLHVFNMSDPGAGVVRNEVTQNRWVWVAVALCFVLVLAALYLPTLAAPLGLSVPGGSAWLVIAILGTAPLVIGRLLRVALGRRAPRG
ncbi:MAG: cation-translocating P-type ATPase [Planctomycetota bacterium]